MGIADAARALRKLIDDPEDTSQVFRIIEALSGETDGRISRRLRASSAGRRLLARRPDLIERLRDRDALRALPVGSLGRAYVEFCESEGISADGLVRASEEGYSESAGADVDAERLFVSSRMRDSHDLWHVVTGYKGDLIGEVCLLAFTFSQTWNRGVGLIVLTGLLKAPSWDTRSLILSAFRRGRRATYLPAADWEQMLALSLSDVRSRLSIGPPPTYEPIRTGDLDAPLRII